MLFRFGILTVSWGESNDGSDVALPERDELSFRLLLSSRLTSTSGMSLSLVSSSAECWLTSSSVCTMKLLVGDAVEANSGDGGCDNWSSSISWMKHESSPESLSTI